MAKEASAGMESGRINLVKIVKLEAPSNEGGFQQVPRQGADVVEQQIGRQRQAKAGVRQPDAQKSAVQVQFGVVLQNWHQ